MDVTILGAGGMARGLAARALAGGHSVQIADRTRAKADALVAELGEGAESVDLDSLSTADVTILALPFAAAREVAREHADEWADQVVVDISNPVDFSTFDSLTVPPGTSAAELIAAEAPQAHVVKAFNTTFAAALLDGQVGGQPLDVFIAGDEDEARARVAELATSSGMRVVDAGPLRRARELEALQFLHIVLQDRLGLGWASAIKILQ